MGELVKSLRNFYRRYIGYIAMFINVSVKLSTIIEKNRAIVLHTNFSIILELCLKI